MGEVVDLPVRSTLHRQLCASLDPEYLTFCSARSKMNYALLAWLKKSPPPGVLSAEVVATVNAVHYMVRLHSADDTPPPAAA